MGLPNFIERDFASWRDVAKLPAALASILPSLRTISLPQILGPHENMCAAMIQKWAWDLGLGSSAAVQLFWMCSERRHVWLPWTCAGCAVGALTLPTKE